MKPRFTVTLPLKLGSQGLKNITHMPSLTVSNHQLECQLTIPTASLPLSPHPSPKLQLAIQQQTLNNTILQAKLVEANSPSDKERELLTIGNDLSKCQELSLFPFKVAMAVVERQLKVRISKTVLEYQLFHVNKPKFVKNQILLTLDKDPMKVWGLLTMDQSQRIVLQDQNSQFPAIGLWLTGKALDPLNLPQKLSEFSELKHNTKCLFSQDNKHYFYLAKCQPDSKTPQLYLVHLTPPKENIICLQYPLDQLQKKQILTLRSDQHSHLEFTLRSDQKIPKKLENIDCSPILFQEDSTESNEEPDSPRFKNYKCNNPLEIECASLRRIVALQQQEINQLRSELMRVTSSIRQSRCHSIKPGIKSNRPKGKILTQKDLSLGSPSHPSTSTSSNEQPQDWNAWQRFQIVDK